MLIVFTADLIVTRQVVKKLASFSNMFKIQIFSRVSFLSRCKVPAARITGFRGEKLLYHNHGHNTEKEDILYGSKQLWDIKWFVVLLKTLCHNMKTVQNNMN